MGIGTKYSYLLAGYSLDTVIMRLSSFSCTRSRQGNRFALPFSVVCFPSRTGDDENTIKLHTNKMLRESLDFDSSVREEWLLLDKLCCIQVILFVKG